MADESSAEQLLRDFAAAVPADQPALVADVAAYLEWLAPQREPLQLLLDSDDVELRHYLLHLRAQGENRSTLSRIQAALKRFYGWAAATRRIDDDPLSSFNFDRPFLSRQQIRRRQDTLGDDPQQREIGRLRALTRLAETLHRAPDVQTTLDVALATLVDIMGLRTAWAFVLTDAGLLPAAFAPHDFALAGACGLPPGLRQGDCAALREPADCHCQFLLRAGRLRRAVNVVECTRLQDSAEADGDNQGLLFHATVPLSIQGRPVGLLNFATEEWQFLTAADLQLLSAVGAHVSLALERAQLYDLAQGQRSRLEAELAMAGEVQAGLLPAELPAIPGFTLAADWRAAREMAGDFYDVLPLPGGRWGLIIADVSDKGVAAALYMAVVHGLVHAQAEAGAGPGALLGGVNRALARQFTSGMFVTVFYAVLDPAQARLTYANGGHNPPLLRHPDGRVEALRRGGMALGVFDGIVYDEHSLTLEPGAALVAYTDGVTEALDTRYEDYGTRGLIRAVSGAPLRAADLLAYVCADLAAFTSTAPQPDDITLLVLARDKG